MSPRPDSPITLSILQGEWISSNTCQSQTNEGKRALGQRQHTVLGLSIALILASGSLGYAQGPKSNSPEPTLNSNPAPDSPPSASKEEMEKRIELLEAQMEQMRQEISRLRDGSGAAHADSAAPNTEAPPVSAAAAQDKPATPPRPGFDLGAVHVVPYGTIYINLFGNSGGTNNSDVPLFATPTGAGGVSATAR